MKKSLDRKTASDIIWEATEHKNYKFRPVDINTFIDDDEYLGQIYGGGHLFKYWRRLLNKIYPTPFYSPYEEVILSCAIGSGKCVPGSTYISTSKGIKTIEEMYRDKDVGALIRTEDGLYPITAIINNGYKEVLTLKTEKGKSLSATSAHRFRVLSEDSSIEWKRVEDIEIGDRLLVSQEEQAHPEHKTLILNPYQMGFTDGSSRAYFISEDILKASSKEQWLYLSGLIDSAGRVPSVGEISVELNNKDILPDLEALVSSLGLYYELSSKRKTWYLTFSGSYSQWLLAENLDLRIKTNPEKFNYSYEFELDLTKTFCPAFDNPETFEYFKKHKIKIESVEAIHKSYANTYDLSIKDHPSYMINGFVSHNSSLTSISIAYELYKLLALKDPLEYYNMVKTDTIVFMLFAATQATAQDVNWGYISNILGVSPFFKEHLDFKETKAQSIMLTDNIGIQIGSRAHKALGKAVLSAVLDEGNFGLVQDQVKNTYNAIMRRRGSRFQQGFFTPGIVWLVSSPQVETDFVNERIQKADGNKKVLVVDNVPIWKVKAEKIGYCGRTFPVFLGDETQDAAILESETAAQNFPADLVIHVPEEYRNDFEEDLPESIRDIAGRRFSSSLNLFRSHAHLIKTFKKTNLFRSDTMPVHLGTTLNDFQNYINFPLLKQLVSDPTSRFVHLDASLNGDRYGIAGSLCMPREIYDPTIDETITQYYYINDFAIGLEAGSPDGMPASTIAKFLKWLKDQGYPIKLITGDRPAVTSIFPELKMAGFNTKYLSVDTERDHYVGFKQKVLSSTFFGVNNKILIKELFHLRDDGNKVDHPAKYPDGSKAGKDIADAVCGSFSSCFNNQDKKDAATKMYEATQKLLEEKRRNASYSSLRSSKLYPKMLKY